MRTLMKTATLFFLSVVVLVGELGWTPQAEAANMVSFSAARSNLSYLFALNLFGGILSQEAHDGLFEKSQVMGKSDAKVRANGLRGSDTGSNPFTRASKAPDFHVFALSRGNLLVQASHQLENVHSVPLLEVTQLAYAPSVSATEIVIAHLGLHNASDGVVNFIKNGFAAAFTISSGGSLGNEGGLLRAFPMRLSTLYLLWDMNDVEASGNTNGYSTLEGVAVWRNLFGRSNGRTQLWPENPESLTSKIIWFGAGLAGVMAWRIKKGQT